METHISFRNFNLTIDGKEILKNINLDIPKNQITAIIGPSGCGKSTLLRSVNRMNDLVEGLHYSGSITIDGNNILRKDEDVIVLRRMAGMISQTPNPLPMSIFDNVVYGPRIHGLKDKGEMHHIVEQCLTRVGLWNEVEDRLSDPASKLSIGQQQRLCLARSLANEPEILLCDETTSALDPISARIIEKELIELKKDYSIVFVTHILRQAKRLADYAVFLYFGEVIEAGPAGEFFTNPKDPRTQQYLEGVFG